MTHRPDHGLRHHFVGLRRRVARSRRRVGIEYDLDRGGKVKFKFVSYICLTKIKLPSVDLYRGYFTPKLIGEIDVTWAQGYFHISSSGNMS